MTEHIVLGVDGSEGSTHALEWCLDFAAGRDDVAVLVVHALSPTSEFTLSLPPFDFDEWRRGVRHQLERWCKPLRDAGVHYRQILVDDYPARALMQAADEHDAALIVVGAHGHGGFAARLAGGVCIKLIHHATCPVVVVPPER